MNDRIAEYVGIDTETTGLDTATCCLIEASVALFDASLDLIDHCTVVLCPPVPESQKDPITALKSMCDPFVRDMHTASGLWDDLETVAQEHLRAHDPAAAAMNSYTEFEQRAVDMLDSQPERLPLLGSSPGFDRALIERFFPGVAARLHYRTVDASTIIELAVRSGNATRDEYAETIHSRTENVLAAHGAGSGTTHRALYDIVRSAETIRCFTDALSGPDLAYRITA